MLTHTSMCTLVKPLCEAN